MILRNHGTLAVGKNVGECFIRLYYLERAMPGADHGLSAGENISQPPQGLRGHCPAGAIGLPLPPIWLAWPALKRKAYRLDPSSRPKAGRQRHQSVDYRALAKARLPPLPVRISRTALLRRGDAAAERRGSAVRHLKQRVLRDRSSIDLVGRAARQALGVAPFGLGPVGLSGLYARAGKVQARAQRLLPDRPFALSTLTLFDREVAAAEPGFWFQLYIVKDRGSLPMIARAKARGAARCF